MLAATAVIQFILPDFRKWLAEFSYGIMFCHPLSLTGAVVTLVNIIKATNLCKSRH
jgi:hypothetical protein